MSRKSWVYCEKRKKLIPKDEYYSFESEQTPLICPDIQPFVSSVDGSVITGRAALREHNKRNGVTYAEDFKDQWAKQRKDREEYLAGRGPKTIRGEHIKDAIEKVRAGYRPNRMNERDFNN
jgi:hypothetical protein